MRRPHILRGNSNNEMPQDVIWVDTETNHTILEDGTQRHFLDFGYAAYSRTRNTDEWTKPEYFKFNSIGIFWDWVFSKLHGKSRLYIFAHNWAFDAPVLDLFNHLIENDWTLKSSVIMSPPIILRWRKAPHTIQIVDTLNIWRMSLAKLGESIGLTKLTMPPKTGSEAEWETYGRRDVEILVKACMEWWDFLKSNDLGGFASTLAAQAMRTYRHRFMFHDILIDDNQKALELARSCLHGGRTECFTIGKIKQTVYKLDINSQYPAIMQSQEMPTKLLGHYNKIEISELESWLKYYCIVAKCEIKTDIAAYPVVKDKRLIFPIGHFIASLSTPEINHALKHNHIVVVLECAIYEKAVIFESYMNYFYKLRLKAKSENKDVHSALCKLMMNSLYGKTAQKGLIYKEVEAVNNTDIKLWREIDVETKEVFNFRQYAGIIEMLEKETESRDSHPAIAAHITAHGRMQLQGLMQAAGRANYYYCDTDSLWCNKIGYDRLAAFLDDSKLGFIKCEGIHKSVVINGAKDYVVDGKETIKGIRAKAVKIKDNTYEQDKFTTLIGLLRRGDLSAPFVSRVSKTLTRKYTKGIVNKNGLVSPFILGIED